MVGATSSGGFLVWFDISWQNRVPIGRRLLMSNCEAGGFYALWRTLGHAVRASQGACWAGRRWPCRTVIQWSCRCSRLARRPSAVHASQTSSPRARTCCPLPSARRRSRRSATPSADNAAGRLRLQPVFTRWTRWIEHEGLAAPDSVDLNSRSTQPRRDSGAGRATHQPITVSQSGLVNWQLKLAWAWYN